MERKKITATVQKQLLQIFQPPIVSGTVDYLEIEFKFTSDWDGMVKWAHISQGEKTWDIRLTADRIQKSDHLNLHSGTWNIWVHGTRIVDGQVVERITTSNAALSVMSSAPLINNGPLPEVPASAAEQIEALSQKALETSEAALAESEKTKPFALDAKGSAEAAALSAHTADASARTSETAANSAKSSEAAASAFSVSASESAERAEVAKTDAETAAKNAVQFSQDAAGFASGASSAAKKAETAQKSSETAQEKAELAANKMIALGLTGMAVGDKVEVASVDTKGMPTGWRKKGKFELISHIEIKEAGISKIARDKDDNGKPFRLEKLILRAVSASGMTPGTLYLQRSRGSYTRVDEFGGKNPSYGVIFADISEGINHAIAYTKANDQQYIPVGLSLAPYGFPFVVSSAEKSFSIFLAGSSFSVGTVLDVWGVRV